MHKFSLMLGRMTLALMLGLAPLSAQAVDTPSLVDPLAGHLAAGERMDIAAAGSAIVASACLEATQTASGPDFVACCERAAVALVCPPTELNFLTGTAALAAEVHKVLVADESVAAFWAEVGVLPTDALACREALFTHLQADAVADDDRADAALLAPCRLNALVPRLLAEAGRRAPAAS